MQSMAAFAWLLYTIAKYGYRQNLESQKKLRINPLNRLI